RILLGSVNRIDRNSLPELRVQRADDGTLYIVVSVSDDVPADEHYSLPRERRTVSAVQVSLYDENAAAVVERAVRVECSVVIDRRIVGGVAPRRERIRRDHQIWSDRCSSENSRPVDFDCTSRIIHKL